MIKWNCVSCKGKLVTRKEKILKTCNGCALKAKQSIQGAKNYGDAALMLVSQLSTSKFKRKDQKSLVKTLSNPKKRQEVFVKWRGEGLTTDNVCSQLLDFVPKELLDEIVSDYNVFLVKKVYEEENLL